MSQSEECENGGDFLILKIAVSNFRNYLMEVSGSDT